MRASAPEALQEGGAARCREAAALAATAGAASAPEGAPPLEALVLVERVRLHSEVHALPGRLLLPSTATAPALCRTPAFAPCTGALARGSPAVAVVGGERANAHHRKVAPRLAELGQHLLGLQERPLRRLLQVERVGLSVLVALHLRGLHIAVIVDCEGHLTGVVVVIGLVQLVIDLVLRIGIGEPGRVGGLHVLGAPRLLLLGVPELVVVGGLVVDRLEVGARLSASVPAVTAVALVAPLLEGL
eukprot:3748538-Alexandrium_andersonii.AAC.1